MLCYLNLRHEIAAMVPIPGQPGAYFAKDHPPARSPAATKPTPTEESADVPKYHWPRLDGRYLYFAEGRETIARHMIEMGGKEWKGIAHVEARCAKVKADKGKEVEDPAAREQRRMKRAMGLQDAQE